MTTPTPYVAYTTVTPNARGSWDVATTWVVADDCLDRTDGMGFGFQHRDLAERMARAIEDGAIFLDPEVRTDADGRTYVHATAATIGKYADVDLARMGY